MRSDERLFSSGARGLNVRKSRNSECKLQKHFKEMRTFTEGGRIFYDLTQCVFFTESVESPQFLYYIFLQRCILKHLV